MVGSQFCSCIDQGQNGDGKAWDLETDKSGRQHMTLDKILAVSEPQFL